MGCHTWFYKKLNVVEEEILPAVVKYFENDIDFWNKYLYDKPALGDYLNDLEETYPEINDEYAINQIAISQRRIRMINKGLCKEALNRKYCSTLPNVTRYVKGKGFYNGCNDLPHDIFRKYGYPNDKLFSYEETIAYVENVENKCHLYYSLEETKEKLKEFWNENSDGMIDFG